MRENPKIFPSENIYEVVDKLVESVRSCEPEIRYPLFPNSFQNFVFSLLQSIPTELCDKVICSLLISREENKSILFA